MHYMQGIRRTTMINDKFWINIAANWSLEDDGIEIPDDIEQEVTKAKEIKNEDLILFDDISNDEIEDILADLGLTDI